ncbi:hypothetical protein QR680_018202 [Steinernema hermaphroditum]|uniref:Uncharacterized protein n=1 Tax=Steinernema hermaphroditum TaxID=289476 RepID=A0AA39LQC4_9BILA|nr:hypothetical protein QR680_018202 [Steinernema hermaphroditum]
MARLVHFVLLLLVSFAFVSAATQNNINLPTPSKGPIEKAEALPQSLPKNRFSEEKVAVKRDYKRKPCLRFDEFNEGITPVGTFVRKQDAIKRNMTAIHTRLYTDDNIAEGNPDSLGPTHNRRLLREEYSK